MTDRHEAFEQSESAGRWLDEYQRALLNGLDAILDIHGGLHEILLQSQQQDRLDDLGHVLDVEAGLAAILPATPSSLQGTTDPRATASSAASGPVAWPVAPRVRMMLRAHPDIVTAYRHLEHASDLNRDLAYDFNRVGAAVVDLARRLARDLCRDVAHSLERAAVGDVRRELALDLGTTRDHALGLARDLDHNGALTHAHARAHAIAISIDQAHSRALDHASDSALALDLDLAHDLDLALDHAHAIAADLAHVLGLAADLTHTAGINALGTGLARICLHRVRRLISTVLNQALPALDKDELTAFLNDFTASDLRIAQLEDIDLDGVLWSDRTRWPSTVNVEDLRARSQETPEGSGIYTIQPGTTKTRGPAGPTQ